MYPKLAHGFRSMQLQMADLRPQAPLSSSPSSTESSQAWRSSNHRSSNFVCPGILEKPWWSSIVEHNQHLFETETYFLGTREETTFRTTRLIQEHFRIYSSSTTHKLYVKRAGEPPNDEKNGPSMSQPLRGPSLWMPQKSLKCCDCNSLSGTSDQLHIWSTTKTAVKKTTGCLCTYVILKIYRLWCLLEYTVFFCILPVRLHVDIWLMAHRRPANISANDPKSGQSLPKKRI